MTIAKYVGPTPAGKEGRLSIGDRLVKIGETIGPGGDVECDEATVLYHLQSTDFVRADEEETT